MAAVDALAALQQWYLARCDEDWEHSYGVSIDTLDNPGWSIKVDLADTDLAEQSYEGVETHRSEDDWVVSLRDGLQWQAFCGPLNLEEALCRFLDWATAD